MAGASTRSKAAAARSKVDNGKTATSRKKQQKKKVVCNCEGKGRDVRMICCDSCEIWYHFDCLKLTEDKAEQIEVFICDSCHKETGKSTITNWEHGVDGIISEPSDKQSEPPEPPEEEEPSPDDDDEYDASEIKPRTRSTRNRKTKRRSTSAAVSDSGTSSSEPTSAKSLKRKASAPPPSDKLRGKSKARLSSEKSTSSDDPVRKYCIGKFMSIFSSIFAEHGEGDEKEKEKVVQEYVAELEECLYDLYAEVGSSGKSAVGAKYKEHFRMLTFNLEKKDRVYLFKRITSGELSASELSKMSSAELANEQLKQQIENAQTQSLQSSILKQVREVPRAKITHKGEEIIEDVTGERDILRVRESDLERDWEREMRYPNLRIQTGVESSVKNEPSLMSATPISPTSAQTDIPSIIPLSNSPPASPSFDLGNIQVDVDIPDTPPHTATSSTTTAPVTAPGPLPSTLPASTSTSSTSSAPVPVAESPTVSSGFNLSSLSWGGSDSTRGDDNFMVESSNQPDSSNPLSMMDLDVDLDDIGDQDFDMFTEPEPTFDKGKKPEEPKAPVVDEKLARFDSLPQVWKGEITLPMDPSPSVTTKVRTRQVGGLPIDSSSPLWSILLHSNSVKIDGRVPVPTSNKYLVTARLNSTRELVAVTFTPDSDVDGQKFEEILDFLIKKGRHALVFPWSSIPADQAPGKELYLIPLTRDEPIPEYLQLLDHISLPDKRTSNVLLGIFNLSKDKLQQLRQQHARPPPPPPAPASSTPQLPTPTPDLSTMLKLLNALPPNVTLGLTAAPIPSFPSTGSPFHYTQHPAPPAPSSFSPYSTPNIPGVGPPPAAYPPYSQPAGSMYPPVIPTQSQQSPSYASQPPFHPPRQGPPPPNEWDRRRSPPRARGNYVGDRGGRHDGDRYPRSGREFEQQRDSGWGRRGRGRGRGGGGHNSPPGRPYWTDPNLSTGPSGWDA